MKDLALLESSVLTLPADAKGEDFIRLRDAVDFAKRFTREVEAALEERMIEHIEEHGPIVCGDMRYIVAVDKSYKPRMDPAGMTEAFMRLHGGDMGKFVSYLSATAFKHGQLRRDLAEMQKPEMFDEFYETVVRKSVEGKPVKQVKALNTKFI